ncbi:MAG TPA: hypothetical protein VMI11_09265 [Actinomycetes bacterium]|nr:hypothetical protein [Actinomycetes bacterium]
MRTRILTPLVAGALLALIPVSTVGAATSAASVSPRTWSTASRTVTRNPFPAPEVTQIRVGHHATYDRIVIQLNGPRAPGYVVKYVKTLRTDPADKVVNLLGPVNLQIVVKPANGHDIDTGRSTLTTPSRVKWRLAEVKETAVIGDFEAVFTVGVGLAARTPFRVLTLHHPTRIVVDVRH